jgi:hypothetical protein
MKESTPHAFGVDDIASELISLPYTPSAWMML